ncbi:MAG TPA: metallophosphoesterase [Casimicrobiaceae bacterium]|nr:metallophosphoesterase [Casimicrobiaceae bacterium]
MKLNILSDLHLSVAPFAPPDNSADAVILAGDIARPWDAVTWAQRFDKPVLYVPGNHEFYGDTLDGTIMRLREACAGTQVQLLDDDEVVLGGVRFLGSTLWTDFRLFGDGDRRAAAMRDGQRWIRDFTRIRTADAPEAVFTPERSATLFDAHVRWLEERLAAPHPGPTVVITHHAPSPSSIHPRFAGSPLNACFVSDAEHLLDGMRARLWIHGHTHDSFDYVVNGTRVVCNPRGYARDGVNENPLFDPDLVIEIA